MIRIDLAIDDEPTILGRVVLGDLDQRIDLAVGTHVRLGDKQRKIGEMGGKEIYQLSFQKNEKMRNLSWRVLEGW